MQKLPTYLRDSVIMHKSPQFKNTMTTTKSIFLTAATSVTLGGSLLAGTKVLYVTHEPGRFHKYTPQREKFQELAKQNDWELTVISGDQKEVQNKLATDPDFGKGADVIVYNFCFANCDDTRIPHNIITTTKDKGIPALLVHCSLHSFWGTFRPGSDRVHPEGANAKVQAKKNLVAEWKKTNPNDPFPAWPNMTGIASIKHGPRKPIQAVPILSDHPALKGVEKGYLTAVAELYNNVITAKDSPKTTSIMDGKQGNAEASVLWEHPVGKSKALSFTLGHGMQEWEQKEFQTILVNSVEYLGNSK